MKKVTKIRKSTIVVSAHFCMSITTIAVLLGAIRNVLPPSTARVNASLLSGGQVGSLMGMERVKSTVPFGNSIQ